MPTASPAYPVVSVADQTMGSPPSGDSHATTGVPLARDSTRGTACRPTTRSPANEKGGGQETAFTSDRQVIPSVATDLGPAAGQGWCSLPVPSTSGWCPGSTPDSCSSGFETGYTEGPAWGGSRWTPRGRQDTQPFAGAILLAWVLQ